MPSIDGGGVEKNFFLISNYLSTKFKNISVISVSNTYQKKLNQKIKFISFQNKIFNSMGRRAKFILTLFLLLKKFYLVAIP